MLWSSFAEGGREVLLVVIVYCCRS